MLTDNEKFIVGVNYIQYTKGLNNNEKLYCMHEFQKSFPINALDIVRECNKEYAQVLDSLNHIKRNMIVNFDGNISNLTNREKYVFYNIILPFQTILNKDYKIVFKKTLQVILLNNQDDAEIINDIAEQINETQNFIDYIRSL